MKATWNGLDAFADFLGDVKRKSEDPTPLMRRVAEVGRSSTVERVERGGFEPNAPATVDAKGSSKPLVDSGRYLQSLNVAYGRDYAAWGSNDKRARLLNDGGVVRPKTSKFLAFPPDRRSRNLVRRYGSNRAAITGLRADGYNVWFKVRPDGSAGAVLAKRKTEAGRARVFVLLVLKTSITVPARKHYLLDDADVRQIAKMATDWLSGEVAY